MKKKMNLKKLGAVCCAALMMAACLTGCGGAAASPASSAPASSFSAGSAPAALTGTVATGGSTSMEKVMAALQEAWAEKEPEVTVTYFIPDERKSGGTNKTVAGKVMKIDERQKYMLLEDGIHIFFDEIFELKSNLFRDLM